MRHSPKIIMMKLEAGPLRFEQLLDGPRDTRQNTGLRQVLSTMKADGKIRLLKINRLAHWALADWKPSPEQILQELENRSRRSIDGCLLWSETLDPVKGPTAVITKSHGEPIRRLVWSIKRGPLGYKEVVGMTCPDPRCIEYKHMQLTRRGDKLRGRKKNALARKNIGDANRVRMAKLTLEDARAIRASTESITALAERYGVHRSRISAIRLGNAWKEPTVGGMFTGLLADERKAA